MNALMNLLIKSNVQFKNCFLNIFRQRLAEASENHNFSIVFLLKRIKLTFPTQFSKKFKNTC